MRMITNEGEVQIDWVEDGEFPDRDDAVYAVVHAKDLIPNLIHQQDTRGSLTAWINWIEQSIQDRREYLEGLNPDETWLVVGIAVQKYAKSEDTGTEVPVFNQHHPPETDDLKSGPLIYRRSIPFSEINNDGNLGMSEEDLKTAHDLGLRADIDYFHSFDESTEGIDP